jgi:hypothetical protein
MTRLQALAAAKRRAGAVAIQQTTTPVTSMSGSPYWKPSSPLSLGTCCSMKRTTSRAVMAGLLVHGQEQGT